MKCWLCSQKHVLRTIASQEFVINYCYCSISCACLLCAGSCCPPPPSACANAVRALLHAEVLVQTAWFRQLKQPEENSILLQAFLTAGAFLSCRPRGVCIRESRTTWPPSAPMGSRGPLGLFPISFKNQRKYLKPIYGWPWMLHPPCPLLSLCCRLTLVEPCRTTPLGFSHNPVFATL